MAQDYYSLLGVGRNASPADLRSAYRRLVMKHHPDRSSDPKSADIFMRITEAYDTLGDAEKRRVYDASLSARARVEPNFGAAASGRAAAQSAKAKTAAESTSETEERGRGVRTVAGEVTRLSLLFTRGKLLEAERLANEIIRMDKRQPIPYAVLGDIYRARSEYDRSAMMYAYAAQFDPKNPIYQRRHEELITQYKLDQSSVTRQQQDHRNLMTLLVGTLLVAAAAAYVVIAKEPGVGGGLSIISSWTLGLMIMLFLGGVAAGSVMSSANQLDRFDVFTPNALGRTSSPMIALSTIAMVNFWAACALYGGMSLANRSVNQSHLKFLGATAAVTLILTLASAVSQTAFAPLQVLLWGGNIVYIGAMSGWMVADSFKRI